MPTASSIRRLSRSTPVDDEHVEPAVAAHADLPETVLQFGTGAFLRGFADVFLDEANREGLFGGRVVVVGSTGSGRARGINEQDGLYTVCTQGIADGEVVDRCRIVGSLSRAVAASKNWEDVIEFAANPNLRYVISNTTEVGIRFDPEDRPELDPPRSFPGKLAVLLRERARAFDFDPGRGVIMLCCELIEDNGDRLREIVIKLCDRWEFEPEVAEWVRTSCRFCNTLVDRIVPGTPDPSRLKEIESRLGYRDELLVQAEPYGLWAIEGEPSLREALPFSSADPAIVITEDIEPFRERKVRILNGAHSVMVPLSFLCGNDTVRESMEDPLVSAFVRGAILREIVPSMDLDRDDARQFAKQVLDRFANPFVDHELLSIALQQTSKMNVRVLPSISGFVRKEGMLPDYLALGFAAYLAFVLREARATEAEFPPDEHGEIVRRHRSEHDDSEAFVRAVAADPSLWHDPPADLPEFVAVVARHFRGILRDGARKTLESFLYKMNGRE